MAGQEKAERTSFLILKTGPYVVDKIDFSVEGWWRSKTFLTEKYVNLGLSIRQIADETFSSREAVRAALYEFSIPLRRKGGDRLRPSQAPYGFRKVSGELIPHLGEQRVIQSIRKMSEDGLTYRQICNYLKAIGIPTKNRGSRGWQPEMIRRILER